MINVTPYIEKQGLKKYKILDCNGIEMPDHYSGRRRNYEEAKKMVDGLNKNGEYRPYAMIELRNNEK